MTFASDPWCDPPKTTWLKSLPAPPSMRSDCFRDDHWLILEKYAATPDEGKRKPEVELLETKENVFPWMASSEYCPFFMYWSAFSVFTTMRL